MKHQPETIGCKTAFAFLVCLFLVHRTSFIVHRSLCIVHGSLFIVIFKRTFFLAHVFLNLIHEMIQQARHWHGGSGSEGAIGFPCVLTHAPEHRNEFLLPLPILDTPK